MLVKVAIVSYARPFSGNESCFRDKGKCRLDKKYVPNEFLEVHKQAIEYRDKMIAHNDVPYRRPEFLRGTHVAIGHNTPMDEEYIEFSKVLYPASAEFLKGLWDLIISYEKKWL